MKKILIVILMILTLTSCSKMNKYTANEFRAEYKIKGEWEEVSDSFNFYHIENANNKKRDIQFKKIELSDVEFKSLSEFKTRVELQNSKTEIKFIEDKKLEEIYNTKCISYISKMKDGRYVETMHFISGEYFFTIESRGSKNEVEKTSEEINNSLELMSTKK